jgi:hypothetical protein
VVEIQIDGQQTKSGYFKDKEEEARKYMYDKFTEPPGRPLNFSSLNLLKVCLNAQDSWREVAEARIAA